MTHPMRERLIAKLMEETGATLLYDDTYLVETKLSRSEFGGWVDAILAELRVPDQAMTMASYYPDVPAVQRREIFTAMIDAVREGK